MHTDTLILEALQTRKERYTSVPVKIAIVFSIDFRC